MEMIIKKNWSAYLIPGILILLGLTFLKQNTFFMIIGILLIVYNAIRVISLMKVKWTLSEGNVFIEGGFLPWAKTEFQVPVFDIYECIYNTNLFSHIVKSGNLNLRRTEGVTSQLTVTSMTNAKEFSAQVNSMVHTYKGKKNNVYVNNSTPSTSASEEIVKINDLKNKGLISESEYQIMKSKIINQ